MPIVPPNAPAPAATVVITTKNRGVELLNALQSAADQDVPLDVLVIDDASADGTPALAHERFPDVRLETTERPVGYLVNRNRAAALARTPVLVSIDDDAVFTDAGTVRHTLAELDHPRVGAVAIPFVNVNEGPQVMQRAPDDGRVWVRRWFIGTAHALKVDLFRRLGGYQDFFYSQFEEFDYCLRMLDAGFVVRAGTAVSPIHHFQSPKRVRAEIVRYGERNQVLLTTLHTPLRHCPREWAGHVKQALGRIARYGLPMATVAGLAGGFAQSLHYWPRRRPVSKRTYARWQAFKRRGEMMPLDELDAV